MKRWIWTLLCGSLLLSMATPAFGGQVSYELQTPLTYEVTKETKNINGSVFVMLDVLKDSFWSMDFVETEDTLVMETSTLRLTYSLADGAMELYAKVSQETIQKPAGKAAVVENGVTYYPLRDLMEAMDYSVGYYVEYTSGGNTKHIISLEKGKSVQEKQDQYAPFYVELINGLSCTENEVLSPYGLMNVMGMMASGAQGETREEILNALGAESAFALEQYITTYENYVYDMKTSKWGTIDTFNALVYRTGNGQARTLLPEYTAYLQEAYNGTVLGIDRPETFDAFLSEKTNGMITESGFADNFENFDTSFTSTLYLNLPWEEKFDTEETEKGTFYQADGTEATVPFLTKTMHMAKYYKDQEIEAVILPYQTQAGKFAMALVDSTEPLTVEQFQNICQEGEEDRFIQLKFPKFRVENTVDLQKKMEQMGVTTAFGETADFSLVSEEPMNLSCMLQTVTLDVNEEGTTAAAYTQASAYRSMVEDIVTVTFDHPFTYYIYEETSGQVLFAGRMNQVP